MNDRVNRYYQFPVSRDLLHHMREEIGLVGKYLEIFDDLRSTLGNTQLHADNVNLPIKTYGSMASVVGQACIFELVRLAEVGLRAERNQNRA